MTETFDNIYSSGAVAKESETQPLDVIIQDAIAAALLEVHTMLPAKIVKVRTSSLVDIEFLLKRRYKNGTLVTLPVAQNVPVSMPRGADYWVKLPIAVGDTGHAVISERSLDAWNVSGGSVDPADPRTHHLSDAVFVPGLYPSSSPVAPGAPATDMVVHNGPAEIYLQKTGTFKVTNGENELLALINQTQAQLTNLLQQLTESTVNTIFGPQPLNNAAAFASLQTEAQETQQETQTLVGS